MFEMDLGGVRWFNVIGLVRLKGVHVWWKLAMLLIDG